MNLKPIIKNALDEDLGRGDLFSRLTENPKIYADIISKQDGIFGGQELISQLCKYQKIKFELFVKDGDKIVAGEKICRLNSRLHKILQSERTLLNFIQHISGIATKTNQFLEQIRDFDVVLLDTRKSAPGLRVIDKYAIRCGGGVNHRMGLDDCLLLQDRHLKTITDLKEFIKNARRQIPFTSKIEIECDNIEDAKYFMSCGADIIMCDHMTPEQLRDIVKYRNENHPGILIEGTGDIKVSTIRDYAKSGVDALSTGSSIYEAGWIDFSIKTYIKE